MAADGARFDVAVIGAGAAGMMCAATAGQRGRRVLLIDHYAKVGEKIRISGGGRCNFTNLHATHRDFLSRESRLLPLGARALHAARLHRAGGEATASPGTRRRSGQLFCDESAKQIIDMLRGGMPRGRRRVAPAVRGARGRAGATRASTSRPRRAPSRRASLVVATGGLTVPKIGATPFAYRSPSSSGSRSCRRSPRSCRSAFDARAARALRRALRRLPRRRGARARAGAFARRCSSRIAASRARRSCRSRRTGSRRAPRADPHRPAAGHRRARLARGRAPLAASTLADAARASACRSASRSSGARRTAATLPLAQLSDRALDDAGARARGLEGAALGHARLQQGRGHAGRRGHARPLLEDDGGAHGAGPLLHRRGVDVTGHLGGFNFQWAWASGRAAGEAA